jgi:radical SAM-linked protein
VAEQSFRLRINYQKRGRLSYLSHLEMTRAMERLVRRAQLPYATSNGFNVHMKHAFGPALPVGTTSLDEYFDVWLTDYLSADELLSRLQQVSALDLPVLGVRYVAPNAEALQVSHVLSSYELVLASTGVSLDAAQAAFDSMVAIGVLDVPKKNKIKRYDLKSMIPSRIKVLPHDTQTERFKVLLQIKSDQSGSVKPEQLLKASFPNNELTLISSTRTRLEPFLP